MDRRVLWLVLVLGCSRQRMREKPIETREAERIVGRCPAGTVVRGSHTTHAMQPDETAWCENRDGRRHGPYVDITTDCGGTHRTVEHYANGVMDGAFSARARHAMYAGGKLEGKCANERATLTFVNGVPHGPFTWHFEMAEINQEPHMIADARGCHSSRYPEYAPRKTLTGRFEHGVLVGEVEITTYEGGRKILPVVPDQPLVIEELASMEGLTILQPAHRWESMPSCGYYNQRL